MIVIIILLLIAHPKFKAIDTSNRETKLKEQLLYLRVKTMDYYIAEIEDGHKPSFPTINGTLFPSNRIPKDPFKKSEKVTVTTIHPIPKELFDFKGGWIYNKLTGEIRVNLRDYSSL